MKKVALITGITGQDGSFLAEFLIKKGYEVHGIKRKSSQFNTQLIDHIYENLDLRKNFFLHYGDMTDGLTITKLIKKIKPKEIYNLAAQSHVAVSFENPEYITNVNALGALRILESLRLLNLEKFTKFYQASTSEMYGDLNIKKLNEKSVFIPKSPYGASKLFAYWITKIYRESYGIYACNGILFNHESERRGETFITRKITKGLSEIIFGKRNFIEVGNLNSKRDWGYAEDYVKMQWLMLQQNQPDDYVIATGYQISVRDFINRCCKFLDIEIKWLGKNDNEKAIISKKNKFNLKVGKAIVKINKRYFRPNDVNSLIGDASKARKKLKWRPTVSVDSMIKKMIDNDMQLLRLNNLNVK